MDDLIRTVKSLEDNSILIKGVTETFQNETKEQKGGFLSMLLGTVGASLLGNLLSGKGTYRAGKGINRAAKGVIRAGYVHPWNNKMDFQCRPIL